MRFGTGVMLLLFDSCRLMDALWLRRLVACLSRSTPEFDPRLVHVTLCAHGYTRTGCFPNTSLYLRHYHDSAAPYAYFVSSTIDTVWAGIAQSV